MNPISIRIPLKPVGKARPRIAKNGRPYTPRSTKVWEEFAGFIAHRKMSGKEIMHGSISISIEASFKFPKSWPKSKRIGIVEHAAKPDLDNIIKMIDSFNGIIWKDDAQISQINAIKYYSNENYFIIKVRENEYTV